MDAFLKNNSTRDCILLIIRRHRLIFIWSFKNNISYNNRNVGTSTLITNQSEKMLLPNLLSSRVVKNIKLILSVSYSPLSLY